MKVLKRVAIGLGIIMVLCCGCIFVVSRLPSPNPTPTATVYRFKPSFFWTTTPSNTPTITNTHTETATSTATVPPLTQTAQAIAAQRTETAQSLALAKSATAQVKATTDQAKASTATFLGGYVLLNWQELVNYPNKHIGEHIKVYGVVSQIISEDIFSAYVGGYNSIIVQTATPLSGLYPDAGVWIYGSVEGTTCDSGNPCFTNSFGAEVHQPLLTFAFWFPA